MVKNSSPWTGRKRKKKESSMMLGVAFVLTPLLLIKASKKRRRDKGGYPPKFSFPFSSALNSHRRVALKRKKEEEGKSK